MFAGLFSEDFKWWACLLVGIPVIWGCGYAYGRGRLEDWLGSRGDGGIQPRPSRRFLFRLQLFTRKQPIATTTATTGYQEVEDVAH